jgi:tripartite-type tricarboxylate transporter receptor subunit TctC
MQFCMCVARLATLGVTVLASTALAQQYPARAIRMVIPYGVGGNADTVARIIAPSMTTALGQQVVIDNRGGAAGIPGMTAVATAAPDGYTVLFAASNLAANPILYKTLPYDAERDFAPVSLIATAPQLLVLPSSHSVSSVKDLISLAKSKPGTLNYGSAGNGSGSHLATELFASVAGVRFEHVPYKSSGALFTDLTGARIDFTFAPIPSAHQFIVNGRLKALAVSSLKRSPVLPDVPTIAEAALPKFEATTWLGILLPRGAPASVVATLNSAVVKSIEQPAVRERFNTLGSDAVGSTPQYLGSHLKMEIARWKKLAQTVKFEVAN